MVHYLIVSAMALSLGVGMADGASSTPEVDLLASACLDSGGDADRLAAIAATQGWVRLSAEETDALRGGTVPPRSQAGYRTDRGLVHFEDYQVTAMCSVHARADIQATQAALENWVVGGRRVGAAAYVDESLSNVRVKNWRNQFWPVSRGGVAALNFANDPRGSDIIIELSFPKDR
ncbi:hypothetical protein [Brevundimonas sp. Root1279]|uniref:hypothetical protein n=1 Tax=Brevundimonas sp. Root1279 TaxID=1736443 RepID=UPI0006F375E9|nr:hypothetical protein [Brevundimonas sp. Root1279]KQW81900.1 hypothetical protein ASC65_11480 [Brevundimonas sp. Root1279]